MTDEQTYLSLFRLLLPGLTFVLGLVCGCLLVTARRTRMGARRVRVMAALWSGVTDAVEISIATNVSERMAARCLHGLRDAGLVVNRRDVGWCATSNSYNHEAITVASMKELETK